MKELINMADTKEQNSEQSLANELAKYIWKATTQASDAEGFADSDARKAAWAASKGEMKKAARNLIKELDAKGLAITPKS